MTVTAPQNMSFINAFYALYDDASYKKENGIVRAALSEEAYNTAFGLTTKKVIELFLQNIKCNFYISRSASIDLRLGFGNFPQIDASLYDKTYGEGAAERALDYYNHTSSSCRLDAYDMIQWSSLLDLAKQREAEQTSKV